MLGIFITIFSVLIIILIIIFVTENIDTEGNIEADSFISFAVLLIAFTTVFLISLMKRKLI